jgi:hypothetical protein
LSPPCIISWQGLTYSRQGSSGDEEDNDVLITWEDLLVLKCLGPGESDWMGKTQEVRRYFDLP